MSKKSQKLIFREGIAKPMESLSPPTNKQRALAYEIAD